MGRTRRIRFNRLPDGSGWADSSTDDDDDGASTSGSERDGDGGAAAAGPACRGAAQPPPSAGVRSRGGPVRYLAYFAQSLLDFRIPEFESLAAMAGAGPGEVVWEAPAGGDPESPFRFVTLPSRAVARHVAERAVLLRALIEVWGGGPDWPSLRAAVEAYPDARKAKYLAPGTTFRLKIDTWGFKWREERKGDVLDALEFIPFQGRVDLSAAAEHSFWVILVGTEPGKPRPYQQQQEGTGPEQGQQQGQQQGQPQQQQDGAGQQQQQQQQGEGLEQEAGQGADPWCWIYFGREAAIATSRALPAVFTLKERRYLGPTSMDAEMAFVMANMAWASRGGLVFDPYCGTGSLLLAAARFGAYVMGGDIDVRVLKLGRPNQKTGRHEDNFSNYEQYGLPWPAGLLRMDVSRPPFREGLAEVFNAIIGDPPYGIRAGGRKSAHKEGVEIRAVHFVATAPYGLTECVDDLAAFAARYLRPGGRLVFFVPATADTYDEAELPRPPGLALVSSCEQPLSGRYSRRLLTYAKAGPCSAAEAAAWREARRGYTMAIEKVADLVWEARPGAGGGGGAAGQAQSKAKAAGKAQPQAAAAAAQEQGQPQRRDHRQGGGGGGDDGGSSGGGSGGNGGAARAPSSAQAEVEKERVRELVGARR